MRKINRMQTQNYWEKNRINNRISFYVKKMAYKLKELFLKRNNDIVSFAYVLKKIIPSFFCSCILILLIYYLDKLFVDTQLLLPTITKKNNALIDVSIAFIGFDGVFLAIYFSSTASVFASKYSNISEKINIKFFAESIKYSNILVYNVVMLSWFVISLGFELSFSIIVPLSVGIVSIITLFSFFKLGSFAFNLSDVNILAQFSYRSICKRIKEASSRGFFSSIDFQDYYRRDVKNEINYLNLIISYQIKNNNLDKAVDLAIQNLNLMVEYYRFKNQISQKSRWFDKKGEFPDWFTADYASKQIAISTGTSLQYKEVPDIFWFEKTIIKSNDPIVSSTIGINTSYDRYLVAFGSAISKIVSFDNINYIVDELENNWKNYTLKHVNCNCDTAASAVDEWIGIVIDIYLSVYNKYKEFSNNWFERIVESVRNNPYKGEKELKKIVNSDYLNELVSSIEHEYDINGKVVTPKWYIAEVVSYVLRQNLNNLNACCDRLYQLYLKSCEDLKDCENKELLALASIYNKQVKQKRALLFELLLNVDSMLKTYHKDKYFKDLDYDYEKQQKDKTDIHKDNIASYEGILDLYKLTNYSKKADTPDYIGYFYNNLVFDAFDSILIDNDVDKFISQIDLLVENIQLIEKELKNSISSFQPSDATLQLEYSVRLSIMDLAGYFLYYNFLINNNDNVKRFVSYLDLLFTSKPNSQEELLLYIMSYKINTEMHHVIDLNSCEFIDRKQKFQSFIKSKHVIHLKKGAYYKQEVEHNNKYIRAFPYYDDMGYSADFYEFFGIYYLDKYLKSEAKLTTKERWEKEINEEK